MRNALDAMTPAQREARAQAIKLMGEHFTAFVLVCEGDVDDGLEDRECFFLGAFDGGPSSAIGLMERYKSLLLPIRREDE